MADAKRQKAFDRFERLEDGFDDASDGYRTVRKFLQSTDPSAVKPAMLKRIEERLHDLLDALFDARDELLDVDDREREAKRTKRKRSSKSDLPVADRGRPLNDDPTSIPGAIRVVLRKHADGLKRHELAREVAALRGDQTEPKDLASALFAMVRRREIYRNGHHKNYTYGLRSAAKASNGAGTKEAEADE